MMNKTELLKGLYVITDRPLCLERSMPVDKMAALAIAGGARIIQYRNKQSPQAVRLYEANLLAELCSKMDAILLINDDLEIAMQVDAHGVHLGQDDMSLIEARQRLGENKIIGITCHDSLQLAREAEQGGADYVAFGSFYPSTSKPSAPRASVNTLQQAREELSIPLCAIGGITLENAPQLIQHGAQMLAVVNGVFGAWNISRTATSYMKLFD
ncbi:MAG: thiamine phosphate synthase [Thioalkalispiraceae bacterium]|jgi:thiamine-phosphate pyrophosphorylase